MVPLKQKNIRDFNVENKVKELMAIYFEIGAVLAVVFLLYLFVKFLFNPVHIIGNSILGIVLFFLLNAFFGAGIPITFLSVGVVAIGGIPGAILVFLLHATGLGF
ncbi:MAG: pro-sigmaK processing inhibitor BofA family protein [Candidatus Micrarchaeota archaeon]|nr:pro-sigmaK processing inhibitor BofA family protein [Candidatus Micrarchaeota archaeon]